MVTFHVGVTISTPTPTGGFVAVSSPPKRPDRARIRTPAAVPHAFVDCPARLIPMRLLNVALPPATHGSILMPLGERLPETDQLERRSPLTTELWSRHVRHKFQEPTGVGHRMVAKPLQIGLVLLKRSHRLVQCGRDPDRVTRF